MALDLAPLQSSSIEALNHVARLRKSKRTKVSFVSGNFNIVHPGHLRLLKFAADCGDVLIVGLSPDSADGTHLPESLRLEAVQSINIVTFAFIIKDPLEVFLRALKPDFVVKGKEHDSQTNIEQAIVDEYGGKLLFSSGDTIFSSLQLLKKEISPAHRLQFDLPKDFLSRHRIQLGDLKKTIESFRDIRTLVIGDTLVDEYINCDPLGMSQEDPTIVVTPVGSDRFIGGAAIVAAHAHGLGADVAFFSVAGEDDAASFAREMIARYGLRGHLYSDGTRPTTLKQRYRAAGKTLLRVNRLRQHDIEDKIANRILDDLRSELDNCDLLIFSDFNYGALPQSMVDEIISICKAKSIMMVADSQSSSQIGDISRFSGMALITPTEREARLATRDFQAGLVVLAERLRETSSASNIILTLGGSGILIHAETKVPHEWTTDELPALNTSPKDVSGAGDSFLATASLTLATGGSIWQASLLGSLAAAHQVNRVGNVPLTTADLLSDLRS